MKHLRKIIYFWALCDLLAVSIWVIGSFINKEIPIYNNINYIMELLITPTPSVAPWVAICLTILDLSMVASCYFLITQNKFAAILCYLQTPLRLLLGKSSLSFFIQGFHLDENMEKYVPILLIIESVKLLTIILWHTKKLYNQKKMEKAVTN